MEQLVTLLGGCSLLVSGLFCMRYGLQKLLSRSLQHLLAKLTLTPWRGLLSGTVAAALLQSSTAVTLATVGLVSADYLSFYQGLALILGANIGTCATVQLLTLSIPANILLPALIASGGIALMAPRLRFSALAIMGVFSMFLGIDLLAAGMGAITQLVPIKAALTSAKSNPLYGIGGGYYSPFWCNPAVRPLDC